LNPQKVELNLNCSCLKRALHVILGSYTNNIFVILFEEINTSYSDKIRP